MPLTIAASAGAAPRLVPNSDDAPPAEAPRSAAKRRTAGWRLPATMQPTQSARIQPTRSATAGGTSATDRPAAKSASVVVI
jgi:hypothetical protein